MAVGGHLFIMTARLLHDLSDHQLRVTLDVESSKAELDGNAQTIDQRLIVRYIVRSRKIEAYRIPHPHSEWGDED
jgi:hypothetical protein